MIPLTYVELFAGAGGLSLGLEMAGWRCLGHAEWDAFPRRILTHRWPDGWTDVPSEKGKPAADSARYKACGNGVASPVAAWIGFRLRDAITAVSR